MIDDDNHRKANQKRGRHAKLVTQALKECGIGEHVCLEESQRWKEQVGR